MGDMSTKMPDNSTQLPAKEKARQRLKLISIALAVAIIGSLGTVAGMIVVMRLTRHSPQQFSIQQFEDAQRRWDQSGPDNYVIEVQVTGRQAATYRVEVRKGEVISAQRNGQPLKQLRTLGTWSVPGMFGTISKDVENLDKIANNLADDTTPRFSLSTDFDPQYGYPQSYLRLQWGSSNPEVTWKVIEFLPLKE